ncbi:hypothetical protein NKG05_09175 [Oerskovia sp. M15]
MRDGNTTAGSEPDGPDLGLSGVVTEQADPASVHVIVGATRARIVLTGRSTRTSGSTCSTRRPTPRRPVCPSRSTRTT